jgi:hypothetical protein
MRERTTLRVAIWLAETRGISYLKEERYMIQMQKKENFALKYEDAARAIRYCRVAV